MKFHLFIFIFASSLFSQKIVDTNARDLLSLISKDNHDIVMVNFWATWCSPCKKEMPGLLKLQDKYKDKLKLLLVSFDFIEEKKNAAKFLETLNISFDTYINTEDINIFLSKMPDSWTGAIPFTIVYNGKSNTILETILGETSFTEFENIVLKHLNKE